MSEVYWLPSSSPVTPTSVCIGTGRFLRCVLVPRLDSPVLLQTRGRSFVDFMHTQNSPTFPVDTVFSDGRIETSQVGVGGVFSLGHDKASIWKHVNFSKVQLVGVGVTESGLSSPESPAMKDLYEVLSKIPKSQRVCVVNTDNVPNNGNVIRGHMEHLAASDPDMRNFVQNTQFLNSMVDRITSSREDDSNIPKAEPLPKNALVILDESKSLPLDRLVNQNGLKIRRTTDELAVDLALKLRVANGTHTSIAQLMSLCHLLTTDLLNDHPLIMDYLDALVDTQIAVGCLSLTSSKEIQETWEDWRQRLTHQKFGLPVFFITQSAAAKGGIRLGPTVIDLVRRKVPINMSMVYSWACLLRWLTPTKASTGDVYTGWLNGSKRVVPESTETGTVYADGMMYDLNKGWYQFRCACKVEGVSIAELLSRLEHAQQPNAYHDVIRKYLLAPTGGNLEAIRETSEFESFVVAVAVLYARMVAGDDLLKLLEELKEQGFTSDCSSLVQHVMTDGRPLHFRSSRLPDSSALMGVPVDPESIESVVYEEVASTPVIDLHTHLLPPSHGPLCLWGIDELLTYHYLVAEYFMTAPPTITPEDFYAKTKQHQAALVWKALFIDRTPLSEATRGVVTTLVALGLQEAVHARDLEAIRAFFRKFRKDGLAGAERFSSYVHELAGVRYNIMTNIPFAPNEVRYWRPSRKEFPKHYRSALRVDPLLSGDRQTVETTLKSSGYDTTLEGARQFLRDWCDTMKPEYMMASTPHNFVFDDDRTNLRKVNPGVNIEAMNEPGAFSTVVASDPTCDGTEDDVPTVVDENSDLLSQVLMQVCEERDLPVALKIGAHRGVNPRLQVAGDGVVAFADAGILGRLCSRFPKVRFLATFLSRNNQHEACVLASKFGNLHIYMVREITKMRIEMLGTSFTAQHSDARVLDQYVLLCSIKLTTRRLIYKWSHSRSVIARVVAEEVAQSVASGWKPTRAELRRDIGRLFGGSYEEFMSKSFKK